MDCVLLIEKLKTITDSKTDKELSEKLCVTRNAIVLARQRNSVASILENVRLNLPHISIDGLLSENHNIFQLSKEACMLAIQTNETHKLDIFLNEFISNKKSLIGSAEAVENAIVKLGIDLNQTLGFTRIVKALAGALILQDDEQQTRALLIFDALYSVSLPSQIDGSKAILTDAFKNLKYDLLSFKNPLQLTNIKNQILEILEKDFDDLEAFTFLNRRELVMQNICKITGLKFDYHQKLYNKKSSS